MDGCSVVLQDKMGGRMDGCLGCLCLFINSPWSDGYIYVCRVIYTPPQPQPPHHYPPNDQIHPPTPTPTPTGQPRRGVRAGGAPPRAGDGRRGAAHGGGRDGGGACVGLFWWGGKWIRLLEVRGGRGGACICLPQKTPTQTPTPTPTPLPPASTPLSPPPINIRTTKTPTTTAKHPSPHHQST